MLTIWDSVDAILSSTAPPSSTLIFPAKEFSTPGAVQRIITDGYHWIKRKARFRKKCSRGNIQKYSYHKAGLYAF